MDKLIKDLFLKFRQLNDLLFNGKLIAYDWDNFETYSQLHYYFCNYFILDIKSDYKSFLENYDLLKKAYLSKNIKVINDKFNEIDLLLKEVKNG